MFSVFSGPQLLKTTFRSSNLLHTRCVVSIRHDKPSNRQNENKLLLTDNLARTFHQNLAPTWLSSCKRCIHASSYHLAETKRDVDEDEPLVAKYDESGKPLSNWKRMKLMMKAYGYVIIPVHWIIAPVWFGGAYYIIKM